MDNIWIKLKSGKEPLELLAEERARKGISEDDPTYRREALAEWVNDLDALVFKFNASKNTYISLPSGKMEYIFGIDIGFNDSDAIAVLGYSYEDKNVYLVHEDIMDKQDITTLANKIKKLQKKYNPIKMVMDAGALGKKIQEEIRMRHGINCDAAEKHRKFEFIELLNDDLRNSRFKAYVGSQFEEDSYKSEWDRNNPDKLKISDRFHSDIHDAALYAFRECMHYLSEARIEKPGLNDDNWSEHIEEMLCKKMEDANRDHSNEADPLDIDFITSDDY